MRAWGATSPWWSSRSKDSRSRSSTTRPSSIRVTRSEGTYREWRSNPGETARPLKMSTPESPSTSCTLPSDSPPEPRTSQPCSITFHDTGSPISALDRLPADVPDRALRVDVLRVGERTQDLHRAYDSLVVAALE